MDDRVEYLWEVMDRYGMFEPVIKEERMEEVEPRWIEVPAHRVLRIARRTLEADYDVLMEDGERKSFQDLLSDKSKYMICPAELIVIRNKDGKRFRIPRFHYHEEDFGRILFLEEI